MCTCSLVCVCMCVWGFELELELMVWKQIYSQDNTWINNLLFKKLFVSFHSLVRTVPNHKQIFKSVQECKKKLSEKKL